MVKIQKLRKLKFLGISLNKCFLRHYLRLPWVLCAVDSNYAYKKLREIGKTKSKANKKGIKSMIFMLYNSVYNFS